MFWLLLLPGITYSGEYGLSGDYTNQRYVLIAEDTARHHLFDHDTADVETEARLFWNADLALGSALEADNELSISTGSARDFLGLAFDDSLAPWLSLFITNDADVRLYHGWFPSITDTAARRSNIGNVAAVGLNIRPFEALTLTAGDELELYRYLKPDSTNSNYSLNRVKLAAARDIGDLSSLQAGYAWSRRFAGLHRYSEHAAAIGIDYYFDTGPHCLTDIDLARRRYESDYPDYWELAPSLGFDIDVSDKVGLDIADDLLGVWYDSASLAYTNAIENRLRLECEVRPSTALNWRFGPELGSSRSLPALRQAGLPARTEDDFRETALTLGLDYIRGERFWLSVENRFGRRAYPDTSGFQSDYLFNELDLLVDWTVVAAPSGSLVLTGMVSLAPEWHHVSTDNITSRLVSLEARWRTTRPARAQAGGPARAQAGGPAR